MNDRPVERESDHERIVERETVVVDNGRRRSGLATFLIALVALAAIAVIVLVVWAVVDDDNDGEGPVDEIRDRIDDVGDEIDGQLSDDGAGS